MRRRRWLRVLLSGALVGAVMFAWRDHSIYRPQRELLACWRAEIEVSGDVIPTEALTALRKQRHAATLATLRRHASVLLPFTVKCLKQRDNRVRDTVNEWLERAPFITWRVPRSHDLSHLAFRCLYELGPEALPVVSDLEKQLQRQGTATTAAQVLAILGPPALPALRRGLESVEPDVQLAALRGLSEMEAPGKDSLFPQVLKALGSTHPRVQASAASAVNSFAGANKAALPQLVSLLRSADEFPLAEGAAFGLSGIGDEGLLVLLDVLQEATNRHVWAASYGGLALADKLAEKRGSAPFPSRHCEFNMLTTRAMGRRGMVSEETTNLLLRLTHYPSRAVRERAQSLLGSR